MRIGILCNWAGALAVHWVREIVFIKRNRVCRKDTRCVLRRPHGSLGHLTPAEFAANCQLTRTSVAA